MAKDHTNKFIAYSAAVLSATVAILTTALIITSNATQGSLNRVHDGVMAMDVKVTNNTVATGKLDTKISLLIARIEAQTTPRIAKNEFSYLQMRYRHIKLRHGVYGNIKPGDYSPPIARLNKGSR